MRGADYNSQNPAREGNSLDQLSSPPAEAPIIASGRGSTQTLGKHMPRKLADKELRAGLCLPGAVCDGDGRILLGAGVCLTETQIRGLIRPSRGGVFAGDDWPDDSAVSTRNVSSTDQPQETLTAETQDDPPTVQTMATKVASKAEKLLSTKFRLLPSSMWA